MGHCGEIGQRATWLTGEEVEVEAEAGPQWWTVEAASYLRPPSPQHKTHTHTHTTQHDTETLFSFLFLFSFFFFSLIRLEP